MKIHMNIVLKNMEKTMIKEKVKCVHCGTELTLDCDVICEVKCECGKVSTNNGVIVEGVQGKDWVDVSPRLLNE